MNTLKQKMMQVPYDYYPATTAQVMRVTGYTNARVSRAYLLDLCREGYLAKLRMKMVASLGAAASIYYGTRKGAEWLASEVDPKYLHACVQTPNWQHAHHWVGLSDIKIVFHQAEKLQSQVAIGPWFQEWDTVNPEAPPEKRARMRTEFLGGKVICNPDSGFALRAGPHVKGFAVELDRHTTGLSAICAAKNPGYIELARTNGHLRFFPGATEALSILSVSLTAGRRDLLRQTMKAWLEAQAEKCRKEKNPVRAAEFEAAMKRWKFCAMPEMTPATALVGAIWYPVDGEAVSLVKTPVKADSGPPGGPPVHPARMEART
jgi:hypothetical protein